MIPRAGGRYAPSGGPAVQQPDRPSGAMSYADLGVGPIGGAGAGASQAALAQAAASGDPAAQAVAASANMARVRNCRVIASSFNAPLNASLGAGQLWGFRQQILPQNPDRKLLLIGTPYSHGDPATVMLDYLFPAPGSAIIAILFQPGPTNLTPIGSTQELSSYLGQAFVPMQNGGAYGQVNFDVPPTNPVTIICWQWFPGAGGYGYDVNVNIVEGV